ncbi:response regulator transcription factor [Tessaracoccus caeni]|uniref:response regulator transcription factor n=1 Tax=Tessaracoccus caeni TaxID=3031239 RepID=UPI0023DC1352|nr:response regulator transcription factor [Tessaracoccus caeni]MDF1488738.1 response regulator transcription factor [Tessaracoccus caeni]
MTDQIRVLLVDDQDLIRTGFRLILLGEPGVAVVGEASDGRGALAELTRLDGACDVVLMDVRMPRMNGIEATQQIVARFPDVRVLVLTTFDLDEYAQAAVQAGAAGFLLKDARPTELVDAIKRVATGDAVMAPSTMRRMMEQMRGGGAAPAAPSAPAGTPAPQQPRQAPVDAGALSVLTEREREVLALIAEGLNNTEIGERLYLSESTVKTHVGRVLFKLNLRDRIHAVILAKELGL